LEALVASATSRQYSTPQEGIATWRFELEEEADPRFSAVEITFSRETWRITKLTLWFRAGEYDDPGQPVNARIEIGYTESTVKENATLFYSENYVRQTGQGFSPAPAYKGYQVINQKLTN
jgi:hypothetical protein